MLPVPVIYAVLQLMFEVKQMRDDGLDYFFSLGVIWNFLDIGSSLSVIAFSFMHLSTLD
jgi:hypothetical protein